MIGGEYCVFGEGRGMLVGGRVESLFVVVLFVVGRNKIVIIGISLRFLEIYNYYYGEEIRKLIWVLVFSFEIVCFEGIFKNVV